MTVDTSNGCRFWVKVTPRSHKNECLSLEENVLKLRLRALPVKGDANKALIEFLSVLLEKPKAKIFLYKGTTARLKEIFIQDLTLAGLKEKVLASIKPKLKN